MLFVNTGRSTPRWVVSRSGSLVPLPKEHVQQEPPPPPEIGEKVVPCDDAYGMCGQSDAQARLIRSSGMSDTVTQLTSLSASRSRASGDAVGEPGAARARWFAPAS